jgi:ABC-type glycerol-3-phosphate transport system permease component
MTTRFNSRLRSTNNLNPPRRDKANSLGSCPGSVNGPAPAISRGKVDTSTFSNALRNIVLGAFLFYCLLPATWIITATSKDIGQLFSTFDLWFASPPHFFENLRSIGSVAGGRPVYNLIALGSLISVLPLLVAFIVLGKYWRRGLIAGAIEG